MKLTPLDIHHKEFRNSLRGYNAEEVDDFLDEVADEFERLFKENIDLSEKLDAASEQNRSYGELERTLQNTLVAAQTSAEDIKSRAQTEADRLLRDAEAKAQEIVSSALEEKQHSQAEYTRLKAAEEEFRTRFRRLLEGFMADVSDSAMGAEMAAVAEVDTQAEPEPAPDKAKDAANAAADDSPEPAEMPIPGATQPIEGLDSGTTGEVVSLTLGEVSDPAPLEDDVPTLEVPAEFNFTKRGPIGELDENDIEEID